MNGDLFPDDDLDPERVLAALDGDLPGSAWPRRLCELVDHLEARFRRKGLGADQARALAEETALAVADLCGGRQIYLPNGQAIRRALRNARIWRDFNGRNIDELARKYRLSTACIYQILAEQRRLRRGQGELFGEG